MFTAALSVLLATHLLCMNVASGAPILCVWLGRRSRLLNAQQGSDADTREIVLRLALLANWALVAGALVGFALGLLSHSAGSSQLAGVLPLFRYKIGWALIELVTSAVWMFAFWWWYRYRPPVGTLARWSHGALGLLSATNLLYHFPTLLTVMSKSARGELELSGAVDPASFRLLAFRPEVIAHSVHFWWASIAVSGVFLFWLVKDNEQSQTTVLTGARFACFATAMQIPTGLCLLMVTPPDSQSRMVGGDPLPTALLGASVFCAFYLLQNLAAVSFGDIEKKLTRRCSWLLILTVLLMSATLHLIRH